MGRPVSSSEGHPGAVNSQREASAHIFTIILDISSPCSQRTASRRLSFVCLFLFSFVSSKKIFYFFVETQHRSSKEERPEGKKREARDIYILFCFVYIFIGMDVVVVVVVVFLRPPGSLTILPPFSFLGRRRRLFFLSLSHDATPNANKKREDRREKSQEKDQMCFFFLYFSSNIPLNSQQHSSYSQPFSQWMTQ